jgi:hypothetical protein
MSSRCRAGSGQRQRQGDPCKALADYLLRRTASGDPILHAANVAGPWNAHYEGRTLELVRPSSVGKVGITIRGTRFKAIEPSRGGARAGNGGEDDEPMPLAAEAGE